MATYTMDKFTYGGNTYVLQDSGALQLTGGNVTGPVNFGDSVTMDDLTTGQLIVTGNASFTNNINANTINGVAVGSSPKFTDTTYTAGTGLTLTSGQFKHSNSVTAGTAGTSSATSGSTLAVPYVTYDAQGHITGSGTHTHTINGFLTLSSTLDASKLSGAIPSAVTATTQTAGDSSTKLATTAFVSTAVSNAVSGLTGPMVFKGTVGTNGTITSLPTAAASNKGYTYKVITALSSPSAEVGDVVISDGSSWVVVPSGDEPSGTVTNVAVSNGGGLSVSGSPITSSGTITISHADTSSQASITASNRTYIKSVTLDGYGHVTGLTTGTETVTDTNYYHKTGTWNGLTYTAGKVGSPDDLAFTIPTGTTATTVAIGNHTHDDRYYTETEIDNKFTALTNTTTEINKIKFYSGIFNAGRTYIGWIKIASFTLDTNNYIGENCYDFGIYRGYNSPASESYNIKVNTGWGNASIIQLNGKVGNQIINKFRLVRDNTNHICYFEIYVNPSYSTYQNSGNVRIQTYNGTTLTLMNEVQTEEDSAFEIISSIDLKPQGTVTNSGFYGNLTGNVTGTATGNLTSVQYDSTNAKLIYTKNGSNTDIVTVATLKSALGSMPASDVYSWAKASTKPTYTASEVGALASNTTYVSTITTTAGTHSAISNKSGAVSFNVPTTAAHVGIKFGYTTSGNNRAVQQDSSGNLYVVQKDDNTTYSLSGLGGVGTVSASGTAPLTLSASKSGTTVTITGSVADASTSAKGVVTTGSQSFKGDKTFQSNTFRIRNENNDNNQAGSNPWITQLNLGDGNYVTMTEYKDDHLALRGSSILLFTATAPTVYSNTATYSVGALVWYNKAYYRCTTAITTAEEWTAGHWTVLPSTAIMSHSDFNPTVDNTYSLGTSSYRWANLYTTKINGTAVPSSPKFTDTDTVTTVTASGTGNVVTGMTASNGAITYTMGTVSTTAAQIIRW